MRLDSVTPMRVAITLSKRNLLALLSKVDEEGSGRTIFMDYPMRGHPQVNDGNPFTLTLYVRVEPDEQHYKGRDPGAMIGWTEEFILEHADDDWTQE